MEITLSRGKVAQIDDADAELVNGFSWHAVTSKRRTRVWYAMTQREGKTLYMHRLLMGEPPGQQVDHIDGDGLNNQRGNLRVCTPREQTRNAPGRTKRAEIHSQYKGVSWHWTKKKWPNGVVSVSGMWRAEIELPGRRRKIRYSKDEVTAARLHDEMAKEHFGDFARLNFPG